MDEAQRALTAGVSAFKAGRLAEAERLITSACHAYPQGAEARWTACIYLGMICRKEERWDDAIRYFEMGLPYPAAFKELVKMYRGFAKDTKRSGDATNGAEWYRRMFCLAKLHDTVMTIRAPGTPVAIDWARAALWLEDIRRQCGTIYAYQIDGRELPQASLLSGADRQAMGGAK